MMALQASGTVARRTPEYVALEARAARVLPTALVEALMMARSRMATAHRVISTKSLATEGPNVPDRTAPKTY